MEIHPRFMALLYNVDTMGTTCPSEVHEIHKEKKAQDLTRQPAERSADLEACLDEEIGRLCK